MSKGSNITKLGKLLNDRTKSLIDVQTHWCIAKSIDWSKKTMVATGVVDDCDFHDVNLGIGSINRKPTQGTKCLIGIINNNIADAFLLECEQIDIIEIIDKTGFKLVLNNGKMTINGDQFGGLVKATELTTQIKKNTDLLESIKNVFQTWAPVPNDGGASLKTASSAFSSMPTADLSNIENKNVKQG